MENALEQIFRKVFLLLPSQRDEWDAVHVDTWDSMGHMMLISEIEQTFNVTIPPEDYFSCSSYDNIIRELRKLTE